LHGTDVPAEFSNLESKKAVEDDIRKFDDLPAYKKKRF